MEINKTAREKTRQCTFTWKGIGQHAGATSPEPSGDHMILVWAVTAHLEESRSQDMAAKAQPGETQRRSSAHLLWETHGPSPLPSKEVSAFSEGQRGCKLIWSQKEQLTWRARVEAGVKVNGVGSHSVILRVSLKLTGLLFPSLINRNGVHNPLL